MPSLTQKNRSKKNVGNDGKVSYKLINNAVYGKTMENLRNRIDATLVINENKYLKWTSKPSFMSQKIFGNDLRTIQKIKSH